MDRLRKAAVLMQLVNQMSDRDSWCGETHLQKAVFFLQHLLGVPLEFSFVLYKHGPFSFDLREELASMRADGLVELVPQQEPYGPRFVRTSRGEKLCSRYPRTLGEYEGRIGFVADKLGDKGAAELERLGTAFYMMRKHSGLDEESLAERINKFKPHVSTEKARDALVAVRDITSEADRFRAA